MDGLNVFFRAFLEYRKKAAANKHIRKMCEEIQKSSTDDDMLEMVRTQCVIEEDWILILEEGLEHVEKAIHEERQFIRKEGEVVPIEKLKRVSTETVRHLAKHSNLITKEPEPGEDVMPEKLYMAENLSDYTVYENRFLYMLLCYARDFITARLDKILELGKTCQVTMNTKKYTRMGKKTLKYTASLYYEDKNDNLADAKETALIERIETAQSLVIALLMTPLMREVGKAPMLTPPITRTNVLRMDVHFKAALEMYGKLTAYTKDGYIIQQERKQFKPFPDAFNAEFSESIMLQTYLAYKQGNQLADRLKEEYEAEEQQEHLRKLQESEARLLAVKQDLENKRITPEEYILAQEERIKLLEKEQMAHKQTKERVLGLHKQIDHLQENILGLNQRISGLQEQVGLKDQEIKYEKQRLAEEKKEFISQQETVFKEKEELCNTRIAEMEEEKKAALVAAEEANQAKAAVEEKRIFLQAQLHGLRQKHGLTEKTEDYTSEEDFLELEKEFEAFEKFFGVQWTKTKKRIRKDILGRKKQD